MAKFVLLMFRKKLDVNINLHFKNLYKGPNMLQPI